MRPFLAVLVAGLLAMSCTQSEPGPQLRARERVGTIGTQVVTHVCCGVYSPYRFHPGQSEDLVVKLREQQPSWLRYIEALEVVDRATHQPPQREVLIHTGIFVNEPGKELGATICRAMVGGKVESAFVTGRATSDTSTLATCP